MFVVFSWFASNPLFVSFVLREWVRVCVWARPQDTCEGSPYGSTLVRSGCLHLSPRRCRVDSCRCSSNGLCARSLNTARSSHPRPTNTPPLPQHSRRQPRPRRLRRRQARRWLRWRRGRGHVLTWAFRTCRLVLISSTAAATAAVMTRATARRTWLPEGAATTPTAARVAAGRGRCERSWRGQRSHLSRQQLRPAATAAMGRPPLPLPPRRGKRL